MMYDSAAHSPCWGGGKERDRAKLIAKEGERAERRIDGLTEGGQVSGLLSVRFHRVMF